MSDNLKLVGTRIRDLRKLRGLSQEALAEKAGFNISYIGFVERAERNVSMKNLGKIANALDVGVYELFTYLKEQEELPEESTLKEVVSLLRERDPKDVEMVKNVLIEIFRRIDENG
ncbi:helix-turn-helix domain-containing protein [Paenibacillus sp. HJL G12]|uniref:Helix-turn-helix domain-containing protein n=1 Tax=Paenibacillus dendrobii TaxID=2691084 RepID=A0A7X3IPN6_9BACL|nr:helix-turn-helix transcriptional regulator [Paenibacillus dendrobii]MWV47131.1 helix-turn-helix domain-containing protein [Paenibacillus dendrobii]